MDIKRLTLGISILLVVAGLSLACFAEGGIFQRTHRVPIFGGFRVPVDSHWPTVGYVLAGCGGLGLALSYAMKRPDKD